MIFQKLLSGLTARKQENREAKSYNDLIRQEAKIGGQLFGPLPEGVYREFFCLDEHTWVWHEEWTGPSGVKQIKTTSYDVRSNGIFKTQDSQPYQPITIEEAHNLYEATQLYKQKVRNELYSFV